MTRKYVGSENEQCKKFASFLQAQKIPFMRLACEIPTKHFGMLRMFKQQGFVSGYPDYFILLHNDKFPGLAIEMKSTVGAYPTQSGKDPQHDFLLHLSRLGYIVYVCKGTEYAEMAVNNYLGGVYGHLYLPQVHSQSRRPKMMARCYNILLEEAEQR
jgi:hypothetical protein